MHEPDSTMELETIYEYVNHYWMIDGSTHCRISE